MAETGEYGMMFGRKVDDLDGCPAWDPVRFAKRDRSIASLFHSSGRLSFVLEHLPFLDGNQALWPHSENTHVPAYQIRGALRTNELDAVTPSPSVLGRS